jgi:hypothetical protein
MAATFLCTGRSVFKGYGDAGSTPAQVITNPLLQVIPGKHRGPTLLTHQHYRYVRIAPNQQSQATHLVYQ